MILKPSEELAYWVGAVQGDGYFKRYTKNNKVKYYVQFGVCQKSLPMLEQVQKISSKLFNRNAKIFYSKKYNQYLFKIGVKNLIDTFKKSDISFEKPTIAPLWCLDSESIFCAYLAGLIDADGDVRVGRLKYPQCAVRIWTNSDCYKLKDQIAASLHCSVNINSRYTERAINMRSIKGTCYRLEFYISKKNKDIIKNNLLNHLQLKYKAERIKNFIDITWPK